MIKIIHLVLLGIVLAGITGCNTSSLTYQNATVNLQLDDNHFQVQGKTLHVHTDNYANIFLTQRILRLNDGSIVVYEEAKTDDLYEFNYSAIPTIKAVFDARAVSQIYFKSSFYLLQLTLQDGSILNLAAENIDDQRLAYVYGMNTGEFRKMLKQFATDKSPIQTQRVVSLRNDKSAIQSRWNSKKINFIPLVTPVRYVYGI